jgi:formamidopyrimidine-DNA glycosylase
MTGRLYVVPDVAQDDADRWVHVRVQLDNAHQLRFSDARKFGRVILTDDPGSVLGHLGPEPLDDAFTLDVFQARLAGRGGLLKPLLLNQRFIAGIGNIYADEALWASQLHPRRAAVSPRSRGCMVRSATCWPGCARVPASTGTASRTAAKDRRKMACRSTAVRASHAGAAARRSNGS